MSADMFTTKPVNPLKSPEPSRIPLPSPTPLRRYGSLRLRGENKNGLTSAGDLTRNIESFSKSTLILESQKDSSS